MTGDHGQQYWNQLGALDPDIAVIDPADTKGLKSRYISDLRDEAFRIGLARHGVYRGDVLDFGCGTGSSSIPLLRHGHRVVGLDIANALLTHAKARHRHDSALWVQIDGRRLPLRDRAFDAAICYVVLSYVTDDATVIDLLRQLRNALRPQAPMLILEQVRSRRALVEQGRKIHRSVHEWTRLLEVAGFIDVSPRVLRHGRFPMIPLIRQGLIPKRFWPFIRRLEALTGKTCGVLPWDYAEVLFDARA
ncbi:class I SAM-dependent methyltransferase [Sinimarinibacterium thermocellulolyticum]|uniref:Class I SAM-dependent methyltransferase n=1 Tax=Sinimarinibacterium thermocellulolyticum TaxID=3170016 RepID=A0ABV2AAE1_9GAMM